LVPVRIQPEIVQKQVNGINAMRHFFIRLLLTTGIWAGCLRGALAQDDLNHRLDQLSNRVAQLESRPRTETIVHEKESTGAVLFLFGIFCALWAQNTNRNPWLWFFLGLLFSIITGLVLLAKNSDDRKKARTQELPS
jgi:hypothetical protein